MKEYDLYDPEIHKEFIKVINDETLHTANLLENLLTWSMNERGIVEYKPEKLDLKSLVDETANHLKYSASQKMIKFELNVPDDLFVIADNHMLSTIVRNLTSNAIKFSNDGG
jgi:signal transduction histidine kinase